LEKSDNEDRKNLYIYTMLEQDAFDVIHENWAAKGFPFPRLIPSFATSIGVSGDTPAALSTLMGIVLNDGKRLPYTDFTEVHLGRDTPYERNFVYRPPAADQVLDARIAAIVKENLENIVQNGTARRAKNAVKLSNGEIWALGGKTGTGDNRIAYLDRYGNVETSEVRNRTATFVFNFGARYFGTMVAYAAGEDAENEEFTSSLPTQAFKEIMKDLTPLLERPQEKAVPPAPSLLPAPSV
ncbi:MAG: penicillin-binding transpeptidase domain-containing protein, partial [Pseudomonadota bacterium]|nr:penicillin-binding transpeptidase domain-containing protein [Pseudomonadota bacterium]